MPEINAAIQAFLTAVVVAAITAIAGIATSYIRVLKEKALAKIAEMEDETVRRTLDSAVRRVDEVVCTVVTAIEQEEKQEILKALEDGTVTRDELVGLKDIAVERVKKQLLPETLDLLNDAFGDFTEYISQKVSQQVFVLKQQEALAPLPLIEEGLIEEGVEVDAKS